MKRHGMKSKKVGTIYFGDIIARKDWKINNSELLKENPCFPQTLYPNYKGKETPGEREIM